MTKRIISQRCAKRRELSLGSPVSYRTHGTLKGVDKESRKGPEVFTHWISHVYAFIALQCK